MTMAADDVTTLDHTLADSAIALATRWVHDGAHAPADPAAERLAGVLKDPHGLDFTIGFVDRVVRPHDLHVAGRNLRAVAKITPRFLPWYMRFAIWLGGVFGPILPGIVVPISRSVLRRMVGHLIVDATPARLGPAIAKLRSRGARLNLNLLGEAVLGEGEAARRLEGTKALLARDDVDYVSIKVSSVVSQLSMWAFDEAVDEIVHRLTPLFELAAAAPTPKFINLDMEEYKDLDLTIAVFQRILDQPQLLTLEAGIVLQAYLPDALGALQGLNGWASARVAQGGAAIKVRLVKGANLAMEHVDAAMHGWPLATWASKRETDTNYLRVLDWALTPERTASVKIGVAGHNLFDVAFAWLLAGERGVQDRVEFEMLLGMATGQADAVTREVGGLLLYTPVVRPSEFDVAIAYLIRRLEENASEDNFMSAVFELDSDQALFERERDRFLASVAGLAESEPAPNRTQDRTVALAPQEARGFHNEPDTDPAIAANRAWGRAILSRAKNSTLGTAAIEQAMISDAETLGRTIVAAAKAGAAWGALPASERARILHRAGRELAASRADLIEVMASETGKTIAEGDPEVSEATDFAHYYAEQALLLEQVDGARFTPFALTVVTPPWNFPVAIPAGSVLAALAAGSAVIIKPAALAQRSGAVMVEALWRAGVPKDVLTLVQLSERDFGQQLVSHPLVDQVILTGGYETAELFRSWRPDLRLHAETSGKNTIIVTPSADFDLAAADIVKSAFGHAGQKCSAASIAILVGSVAQSPRFLGQLVDSTPSLRVGYPQSATSQMGPIIEPANGKLLRALTTLGDGERWLVEPKQLDDSGMLWSPGIRTGVKPGSEFHLTEYFGPVLGIMHAATLAEAIELQRAIDYGLTSGLHSLDPAELAQWLDGVEAGNLYVNRGITGAIVQRQPFGGWKRSSVGAGAKAGGPNYLFGLGQWTPDAAAAAPEECRLAPAVGSLLSAAMPDLDAEQWTFVHASALRDAMAWASEFGIVRDPSGVGVERNLFRYLPMPVTVRHSLGSPFAELVRVLAAARLAGSEVQLSSAVPLPAGLAAELASGPASGTGAVNVTVETEGDWLARAGREELATSRIRLIGGDRTAFTEATGGNPDLAVYASPVTAAGRVELLPFLHEQAISITAHRFGNPDGLSVGVI
jgi:RHH-type proline utilization regulon transcriptional repressor/proline dehydrogenase/delta 1-pyrroline-5-carboxylate dehydrogenase